MPGIGIITSLQAINVAEGNPMTAPVLPDKSPHNELNLSQPLPPTEPLAVNPVRNVVDIEV